MKNEHEREPTPDETAGMVWWNSLAESDRAAWLAQDDSAVPLRSARGWFGDKTKPAGSIEQVLD